MASIHSIKPLPLESRTQWEAYFWEGVARPDIGCWLWPYGRNGEGYGQFTVNRCLYLAHRLAYGLQYGDPGPAIIRHSCDVPLCIRPDHLLVGTMRDNMMDAIERGLYVPFGGQIFKGERHGCAKLRRVQVEEIRRRHAAGEASYNRLAREYGVTKGAIAHIISRRQWR